MTIPLLRTTPLPLGRSGDDRTDRTGRGVHPPGHPRSVPPTSDPPPPAAQRPDTSPGPQRPSGQLGEAEPLTRAPWRLLLAPGTQVLREPTVADVTALPAGSCVALVTDRLLARERLRRLAHAGGLVVERELLLLPTSGNPLIVLDDDPASVRQLWDGIATVPPGIRHTVVPTLALRLARRAPWWLTGAWAPGRLLLGRKP